MQDTILSRSLHIRNRKAAAALTDPFRRRILLLFVGKEYGVAELAKETGMEIKRLHYHVGALAKLGLLKNARSRRRNGRPIKLYQASAPAFFVPAEIAPQSSSVALARHLQDSLLAARTGRDEGMLYHIDEKGQPRMKRLVTPASGRANAAAEIWRVLSLSREDAEHLSLEIAAVIRKYADRTGRTWLVHFAADPMNLPIAKDR